MIPGTQLFLDSMVAQKDQLARMVKMVRMAQTAWHLRELQGVHEKGALIWYIRKLPNLGTYANSQFGTYANCSAPIQNLNRPSYSNTCFASVVMQVLHLLGYHKNYRFGS